MTGMRAAAVVVLAAGLALLGAGCGSVATTPVSENLGSEAATLVPPDSLAFVSVDTRLDSEQWQVVEDLTGGLELRNVDLRRDVQPAVGDELNLAVLGLEDGEPVVVALVHPKDEAKLRALAAKFDEGDEHYTVEQIGGWSVIADSAEWFEKVRAAESGRSLADVKWFQDARGETSGGALVRAYADGAALRLLPDKLAALARASGSPRWVATRAVASEDAVEVELHAGSPNPAPSVYRPRLLREVPSGALLAVSFKNVDRAVTRLAADLGLPLPALRGEGVLYLAPAALIPVFVLEVESPNPQEAARSLRAVAARIKARTGNALPVQVLIRGNRVFLTNGAGVPSPSGSRLVDDQAFKDAAAAADVPSEVTWLAYADVQRLAPLIQALSPLLGQAPPSASKTKKLERLGTLVAFGARSGPTARLELRLTIR
jgi:hypothetical protein